jgi:Ni/Co efflux regulator RcnB
MEDDMTKWLISSAFATIVVFGAVPALAQGPDDQRGQWGGHERGAAPEQGRGQAQNQPQNQPAPQPAPRQQQAPQQGQQQRGFAGFAQNGPPADQRQREDRRPAAGQQEAPQAQPAPRNMLRGENPNNATPGPRPGFARGQDNGRDNGRNFARGRDNGPDNGRGRDFAMRGPGGGRPDFNRFHRNFNAPRHFRVGVYNRPRGWYAHHWVFGEVLPSLFWTSNYWINDYMAYDLEPPPPGTVWVRDGEDALLIDRFSGEIIEVAYNVFY